MAKDDPVRFGAEFGPKRTGTTTGVSLSLHSRHWFGFQI